MLGAKDVILLDFLFVFTGITKLAFLSIKGVNMGLVLACGFVAIAIIEVEIDDEIDFDVLEVGVEDGEPTVLSPTPFPKSKHSLQKINPQKRQ